MQKYLSIDSFISDRTEEIQSVLQFARHYIKNFHPEISEVLKYNCPFFLYKGKRICYLNSSGDKAYIGFLDGKLLKNPNLVSEGRTEVKVFYLDTKKDIRVKQLNAILKEAIGLQEKHKRVSLSRKQ
jgi:hypothetical protein